jgi:putative solute:sodium symporter small subunit
MQTPDKSDSARQQIQKRYWRQNVGIMSFLLLIWAAVGLGAGVLFADSLNAWHLGGYPLGFWFAQQGSILFFVVIVLAYALMLNRLDIKHHEELARLDPSASTGGAG